MTARRPTKLPRVKSAYHKPEAGEWQQPIRRGYRLACCDCGLVHLMNFRTKNGRVQFAVFRAVRSTAALRKRENHLMIPASRLDDVAAAFLKATGKKSVRVGRFRYRLRKKI